MRLVVTGAGELLCHNTVQSAVENFPTYPALVLCIIFTSCHLCLDLLFTGTQEVPSSAWKFGRGSRTLQKVLTLVSLLDRWTFIFTAQHFLQMYSCCSIANILFPILFYTQFLCLCHSLKCSGLWIATRERTELL